MILLLRTDYNILIIFSDIVFKRFFPGSIKFVNTEEKDLEILQKAFDVFVDWPHNFINLINLYSQTTQSSTKNHHTGVMNDFGYLYIRLASKLKSKQFYFIRSEFDNYLINKWEGGLIPAGWKDLRLRSRFITGKEAVELMKISHLTIVTLIVQQILVVQSENVEEEFKILVEKNSVTKYLASTKNLLTATEVKSLLGICSDSIHKLLLNNIIQGKKNLNNKKTWAFQKASVESLLSNFEKEHYH